METSAQTCPALFARTGKWTETHKRDHLQNDHHPDGCVIRADCSHDIRYDDTLGYLARHGYGIEGWDMWKSGMLGAQCDPVVVMERCECGSHVHPDRWMEHECYVTRGENRLAEMMG